MDVEVIVQVVRLVLTDYRLRLGGDVSVTRPPAPCPDCNAGDPPAMPPDFVPGMGAGQYRAGEPMLVVKALHRSPPTSQSAPVVKVSVTESAQAG